MMKLLSLSLVVLMTGCATLSESECRVNDAFSIGHRDGQNGAARSRLLQHQEACSKYGIRLNPNEYDQGYGQGIMLYCTPENGYQQGSQGSVYQGVCPADLEPRFLNEYRPAYDAYQLRKRVDDLQSELEQVRMRKYDLESQAPTDSSRREHRELYERQMNLKRELNRAEDEWRLFQIQNRLLRH